MVPSLTADYSAPSTGPPPWHVYRITPATVFAFGTLEPYGATKSEVATRRSVQGIFAVHTPIKPPADARIQAYRAATSHAADGGGTMEQPLQEAVVRRARVCCNRRSFRSF